MELINETLYTHLDAIAGNVKLVNDNHPEIYQAAEMIRSIFDQAFTSELQLRHDVSWQFSTHIMVFAAYESWLYAYLLTSAGLEDIGYMAVRRAIEFACYIAKIYESDKRAELWQTQAKEEDARKEFSGIFSIPDAYRGKNYDHLREVLDIYELASDYATHANFEMISAKWQDMKNSKKLVLSFHDKPDRIPFALGTVMLTGYRILQSLIHQFNERIEYSNGFRNSLDALADMVRKARLLIANIDYKGNVPREVIEAINDDQLVHGT